MMCPEYESAAEAAEGTGRGAGRGTGGRGAGRSAGEESGEAQGIDMDLLHQLKSYIGLNALACCAIYGRPK